MLEALQPSTSMRATFEALVKAVGLAARTCRKEVDPYLRASALRRLSVALDASQAELDAELFPALFESMAGSDAVCIRDMQRRMSGMHRELALQLVRIDAQAQGQAQDTELLLSRCAQYLAYQLDELFPLAERLLGESG
ncbi:hypothetical protein QTI66_27860 [Variovorax sp. J22R133]|uniref:hypothetical protein n=1 Tax=Variovorax brevis TaxID=3053503 RepID=UPI0025762CC0|nr:hypothetical protein [Variovorax sp. J22R133]MDM0115996.1 hypothetical protein [Variovorax sp. J22R133]